MAATMIGIRTRQPRSASRCLGTERSPTRWRNTFSRCCNRARLAHHPLGCFRYRNKIGLNVALGELRDFYRQRLATVGDLWKCASALRVATLIRPYLESLQ